MESFVKGMRAQKLAVATFLLFMAIIAGIWFSLRAGDDKNIAWQYYELNDKELFALNFGHIDTNKICWQNFTWPEHLRLKSDTTAVMLTIEVPNTPRYEVDHLLFNTTNQDVKIYVDGDLLYSFGIMHESDDAIGSHRHIVKSRKPLAGTRITFLLHTRFQNYLGIIGHMLIADEQEIINNIGIIDAVYIFSMPVAWAMIIFLALELYWRHIEKRRLYLCLIAFLFTYYMWIAGTSLFLPMLLGYRAIWWHISYIALYLLPVFASMILIEIVDVRYKKIIRNCFRTFALVFAAAVIGQTAGYDGFITLLNVFYPVGVVCGVYMIRAAMKSNWKTYPSCRYASYALISYSTLAALDALHLRYHLFASNLHLMVFSGYSLIPFVLYLIREQAIRQVRVERELVKTQIEAETDALTGAYNRHQINKFFGSYRDLAVEHGFDLSLAIFDIDKFKNINDTRGHLEGDRVLKLVATTIQSHMDRRHILVRYGGDEFILIGLHYNIESMAEFVNDLRMELEVKLEGDTMSFGVSGWHGEQDSLNEMIERADKALYISKERGRNQVHTELDVQADEDASPKL